jgi:predicted thioesterase
LVTAVVTAVKGQQLVFEATVTEGEKVVARATHTRFIVNRERFMGAVAM